MKTRIKAQSLSSREEFDAAVNRAVELDLEMDAVAARRDRAILRLKQAYGVKIAVLEKERDAKVTLAEKWALANRAVILPEEKSKGRKSASTSVATFGFRTGNRTVKLLSGFTDAEVIANLKKQRLPDYVRTVEELDKDKLRADAVNEDKAILRPVVDPVGQPVESEGKPVMEEVALNTLGLRITQGETFFVEGKVESANTVKPQEAVAA